MSKKEPEVDIKIHKIAIGFFKIIVNHSNFPKIGPNQKV